MAKYFATGDAIFEDSWPILVLVPHSQREWLYETLFGALGYLSEVDTWVTAGETTPEEAAAVFLNTYYKARPMLFLIGMVADFAGALPDDSGWLQCDGQAISQTEYPDLFAAIGTSYNTGGEPTGYFRVPDTISRVRATVNDVRAILPSWANAVGGTGGEASHTLISAEVPSHSHTDLGHTHAEGIAAPSVAGILPPPAVVPSAVPSPSVTGLGSANLTSDGGDGAHNNIQPTIVFYTYILAKF